MKRKKLPRTKTTHKEKRSIEPSPSGASPVVAKLQNLLMQELAARFATTLYDDMIRNLPASPKSDDCGGSCKGDCWGGCNGICGNNCTGDCTIGCGGTCFGTCNGDCAVKLAADRSSYTAGIRDILLTLRSFRQILHKHGFPR